MTKKCTIWILLILGFTFKMCFAENITFKSSLKSEDGNTLILPGILAKPEGNGPFPSVVLLHGASGLQSNIDNIEAWSKRLVNWGYVTLIIDSLGPRGIETLHGNSEELSRMVGVRTFDAYDAKSYLSNLAFVKPENIAVIGWAHGGMTVLYSVIKVNVPRQLKDKEPFKAAISFYPYCDDYLTNTNAPLLILHGALDDWTPAESCSHFIVSKPNKHEVTLKIYPDAYHCFDCKGKDEVDRGHKLLYNPEAAKDAIMQVKSFLAKYLR